MDVVVDHRVELFSIVFRLAEAQEFGGRSQPAYVDAIDSFFAAQRRHPVVATARRLRKEHGISHDAVMSLAIHVTPPPELAERVPLDGSQLEARWTPAEARLFLAQLRDFARTSEAERFFARQQPVYDTAVRRMQAVIDAHVNERWFADFFGTVPRSRFVLAIGLNNGTWSYGPRFSGADGSQELYAIMGAWETDSARLPTFASNVAITIVHEFAHSFVNPVVERHRAALQQSADTIHARVAGQMKPHGYTVPMTMISESLVRTAVARYLLAHQGVDSARSELRRQKAESFFWIDDLFALFGAYEHTRSTYPAFESFIPVVAAYYADLAPRATAEVEARRPHVIGVMPENGASGVDPAMTEIVVRFDKPMRGRYAVQWGPRGAEGSPEIVRVRRDSSGTVFTMTVKLKPEWSYEFSLNSPGVERFGSHDGIPLLPYGMKFSTGPARSDHRE